MISIKLYFSYLSVLGTKVHKLFEKDLSENVKIMSENKKNSVRAMATPFFFVSLQYNILFFNKNLKLCEQKE